MCGGDLVDIGRFFTLPEGAASHEECATLLQRQITRFIRKRYTRHLKQTNKSISASLIFEYCNAVHASLTNQKTGLRLPEEYLLPPTTSRRGMDISMSHIKGCQKVKVCQVLQCHLSDRTFSKITAGFARKSYVVKFGGVQKIECKF